MGSSASHVTAKPDAQARAARAELNVAAHGLRGAASLMVLIAHILGGTADHVYAASSQYVEWVKPFWYFGTFGVELFFMISGYVILPSALRYDAGEFALRRGLRIYPLFAALSLLFVVLNAWTNAYPKLNDPLAIVSGFLFLNLFTGTEQLTPNAWSLTFEVVFYVLTCAIVTFAVKRRARGAAALSVAAAVLFVAAFPIAIYFLAGVAIRLLRWRFPEAGQRARLVEPLAFALMVMLASSGHFEYRWGDFANPVVIPLILFTASYFYCAVAPGSFTERLLGNRVAAYVGTVSYSLYLVHPYTYLATRKLFARYGLFTADLASSMALFAIVVVASSFALTHFVHIYLERGPYERMFRQRIYRTGRGSRRSGRDGSAMLGQNA